MIEGDYVDAVIGLGKNLFYNISMESCLLICRMKKPKERKGKVIFIDAKEEIRIERSTAYLKAEHIKRISDTYWNFKDLDGFAKVISSKEILKTNNGNLSVQLYVKTNDESKSQSTDDIILNIRENRKIIEKSYDSLFSMLDKLGIKA